MASSSILVSLDENTANIVTAFFPSSSDTSSLRAASRGCKLLFERNCPVSGTIVYYESSEDWSAFFKERSKGNPNSSLRCWAFDDVDDVPFYNLDSRNDQWRRPMWSDRPFVRAVVAQRGEALEHASSCLRANRTVVLEAVKQMGLALLFADYSLKGDRDVVLAAVAQNGRALIFAEASLQGDRDVVLAAVAQDGTALNVAHESLKRDRDVVLAAVAQDGTALNFAHDSLKRDRGVVLTAIAQNGCALEFAHRSFRSDHGVVLAAVAQTGRALEFAHQSFRSDRDFVLLVVALSGDAIRYADVSFRSDSGVVRAAIMHNSGDDEITYESISKMTGAKLKRHLAMIGYPGRSRLRVAGMRQALCTVLDLGPP